MEKFILFLFLCWAFVGYFTQAVPTVVFHGMGDQCSFYGMVKFTQTIQMQTGEHVECLEIGYGSVTSVLKDFYGQSREACEKLLLHSNFQGEFNIIGLSQGSLIGRYIIQNCVPPNRVRNFISIGGPNMGVQAIPHCFSGPFCYLVNSIVRQFVYRGVVQNIVGPAAYFRDPSDMSSYLESNNFLSFINNEVHYNATLREGFSSIRNMMLVKFSRDSMLYPKETAWFQQLDQEGKLLSLNETVFYNFDLIGLRVLVESERVEFVQLEGDHLSITNSDIQKLFVPFLLK